MTKTTTDAKLVRLWWALWVVCLISMLVGMAGGAGAQTLVTSGLVRQFESGSGVYQDAAKTKPVTADGQSIALWADTAGTGKDVTQATAANDAIYKINQFGGQPGVSFPIYGQPMTGDVIPGSAFTVVTVYKNGSSPTPNGYDLFMLANGSSAANSGFALSRIGSQYEVTNFGGAGWQGGTPDTAIDVATLTDSTSAPGLFRMNGVTLTTALPTMLALAGQPLSIGGSADEIFGAALFYNRVLTSAEITQDELYLSNKYHGSVPGTTQAPAGISATFPLTSLSRWGSWTLKQASPLVSAFNSKESVLAYKFIGTGTAINFSAGTGDNGGQVNAFSYSLDGAAPVQINAPASTGIADQHLIMIGGQLTDGPHTLTIQPSYTYYNQAYNWSIDASAAVTVYGANPSASAYPNPRPLGAATKIVVSDGNSRYFGEYATGPEGTAYDDANAGATHTPPSDYRRSYLDPTWLAVNQGTFGELATEMVSRAPNDVDTQYSAANADNALFFLDVFNDINTGTSTAAQAEATTQAYGLARKAAGWKERILCTAANALNAPAINTYNADARTNYVAWGFTGLADIAADPAFMPPANSTYWASDNIHFTDAGNQKVADIMHAAFVNQMAQSAPLTAIALSSISLAAGSVTFAAAPVGGTGPFTYSLTRPGMTAITSQAGTLADTAIAPGILGVYTLSVTDSEAAPVTKTLTQTVVPIGASLPPLVPIRQPSRGR